MTNAEILSLAYQKQGQGDTRPLSEIIVSIQADIALFNPPPLPPETIVGEGIQIFPNGREVKTIFYADGTIEEIEINGEE